MAVTAFKNASERRELLIAVALLVVIGVALLALAPAKQSGELASAGLLARTLGKPPPPDIPS